MNMKTLKCMIAAGAMLVCSGAAASGEKEKNDSTAFEQVVALVKSKRFRVEATDAYPTGNSSATIASRHGTITLGGEGHVSLAGNRGELVFRDSVVSGRLPFFGRGYSLPYGEGGGFEFEETRIEKASVKVVKRRRTRYARLSCTARVGGDVVSLTLEAYENGRCTLHATSNNRASISYGGVVEAAESDTP